MASSNEFDFPGRNLKWAQEGAIINSLILTPRTFSTLPTPVLYMQVIITDSTTVTIGDTITVGAGLHAVLAIYNGTNWIVLGAIT